MEHLSGIIQVSQPAMKKMKAIAINNHNNNNNYKMAHVPNTHFALDDNSGHLLSYY